MSVRLCGEVQADGYVIDFGDIKKVTRRVCKEELNERFLLPTASDALTIEIDHHTDSGGGGGGGGGATTVSVPGQVTITCEDGARYSMPLEDCALLPIVHSTAEEVTRSCGAAAAGGERAASCSGPGPIVASFFLLPPSRPHDARPVTLGQRALHALFSVVPAAHLSGCHTPFPGDFPAPPHTHLILCLRQREPTDWFSLRRPRILIARALLVPLPLLLSQSPTRDRRPTFSVLRSRDTSRAVYAPS